MYLLTLVSPTLMPSFEQFPVNVRSAPKRIFALSVRINWRTALGTPRAASLAMANLPAPVECKVLAVPTDHGGGFDDEILDCRPFQTGESQAQRKRSAAVSFGRLTERWRMQI